MSRKISFIISLFFLFCTNGFAQYRTLPDSNAAWSKTECNGNCSYFRLFVKPNKSDTLINGVKHIKLFEETSFTTTPSYTVKYIGAYYSQPNGKTYIVPKNYTQDYLLYDFSKQAGDTVYNVLAEHPDLYAGSFPSIVLSKYVVDSVRYIPVGPYSLKSIFLHFTNGPGSCFSDKLIWVEKIGCLGGGIFNMSCQWCFVTVPYSCMTSSDTLYFNDGSHFCSYSIYPYSTFFPYSYTNGNNCSIPTALKSEFPEDKIKIAPNPVSDNIIIERLPCSAKKILVRDILGKAVLQLSFEVQNSIVIPVHELKKGIYFLNIECEEKGLFYNKKIIKE